MQLVVQSGSEPGRTYDLANARKVVIGRQSGNDVVVPDEQVSRKHAEVEERDGSLIVTDLGSSNGTFVNGTRISTPQTLRNGDTVQVGTTVLRVVENQAGAATLPTGTNYRQATEDAAYGSAGQGYSVSPTSNVSPSSNQGYGQTPAAGQYDNSYGQQPPAAAGGAYNAADQYGQSAAGAYNQAQQPYGQPAAGGYNAAQQPQQPYGQPAAGGYDANQGYAQNQYGGTQNYGQPATPYGSPAIPVAAKRGLPVAFIAIGGVIAVVIIALVLVVFVFKGSGSAGDLPAPPNSTSLNVNASDLLKLSAGDLPAGVDTSKFSAALYSTKDTPDSVITYYKNQMTGKGWTADAANNSSDNLKLTKGDQTASVSAVSIPDQATLGVLESTLPPVKGKLQVGDTLVIAVQGPTNAGNATPK